MSCCYGLRLGFQKGEGPMQGEKVVIEVERFSFPKRSRVSFEHPREDPKVHEYWRKHSQREEKMNPREPFREFFS